MPLAADAARSRSGPGPARAGRGRPSGRRSASPETRAAASISIRPSAVPISRWSRGSKSKLGASPTSRRTTASSSVIPSGASGSGRLGSDLATRSRSASTFSSSALPDSIVSFSPWTSATRPSASSPRCFASPTCLESVLRSRLGALDLGQQLAAAGVEGEQLVDVVGGAAARQRLLDPLGVGADQLQVKHRARRSGRFFAGARRFLGFVARRTRRRSGRLPRPLRRPRCSGA